MNDENTLWQCSPSQIVNLSHYLVGTLVIILLLIGGSYFSILYYALVAPILWMCWQYLVVRCWRYEITSQRLRVTTGVINKRIDEIELYRIKDTTISLPFWLRLFKLGTLVLVTSDRTLPELEISAVSKPREVRDILREHVERLRDLKRVREVDFEAGDDELEFEG